jgi:hypothetical protein
MLYRATRTARAGTSQNIRAMPLHGCAAANEDILLVDATYGWDMIREW